MSIVRIDMTRGESADYRARLHDTIYATLYGAVGCPITIGLG